MLWTDDDWRVLTVADDVWCDWVELWQRLGKTERHQRTAQCRSAKHHQPVKLVSGGSVCRVCCRYLGPSW